MGMPVQLPLFPRKRKKAHRPIVFLHKTSGLVALFILSRPND